MRELTTKESAVFDLIRRSIEKGVIPSVREIGAELGIKSTSSVHRYLTSLEEKGYIERGDGLNRSIRLPGSQVSHIPVLGVVTAGQPILAVESVEEYIPVQLRGNSKELFAGDLIIARRTPTAENGEIVVALIDDEATVKRFYKENGGFRLQPENDTMEPIYTDHLMILGRVVGLQREY